MICAWCKSDIENDSFYCDQCSKEVFLCPACGKPGKGKSCVDDGSPLYSPRQKAGGTASAAPPAQQQRVSLFGGTAPSQPAPGPAPSAAPQPQARQPIVQPSPQPVPQPGPAPSPAPYAPKISPQPAPSSIPVLRLVNNHLNVNIEVSDGAVVGRSSGDYVAIFSQFSQVSGRHLQFHCDQARGWTVTDLGSTNGSSLSTHSNWAQVSRLAANTPTPVRDNTYLLIANIEFQMQIISPQSSNLGTVRI